MFDLLDSFSESFYVRKTLMIAVLASRRFLGLVGDLVIVLVSGFFS